MSKIALGGIIAAALGTRFSAIFILDNGIQVSLLGNFSTAVQAFACYNATLKYDNIDQLIGTRFFTGQLGEVKINFNMENGPVMDGILNMPIHPGSSIQGSGVWLIY